MASIGIAVTTYNRLPALQHCVEHVSSFTRQPYKLIVCDDGSSDGTREWLTAQRIPFIGKRNRGVAWNKNRGLYALLSRTACDTIVLMEDDCYPDDPTWAEFWIDAVTRHGHINLLHPATALSLEQGARPPEIIGGAGTAEDPFACTRISGLCIGSSRAALNEVGYLDSRFSGYGHEHAEWTTRFKKVGYGAALGERDGEELKANALVGFGLRGLDVPSSSDKSTVEANRDVYRQAKGDLQRYRAPWRSREERDELLSELAASRAPSRGFAATAVTRSPKLGSDQAREALVSSRIENVGEKAPYAAAEDNLLGLVQAVLERRPISFLQSSHQAHGFRTSSAEDAGSLDRNVDVALQGFVEPKSCSRPSVDPSDLLDEKGQIRLLISTNQTDSELIGFKGNVGDNYGLGLVRTLSRRAVHPVGTWAPKDLPVMMTIGSFMQHARDRAVVWGTGCMAPMSTKPKFAEPGSTFLGVRGPRTREEIFVRYGKLPPVIGDPGLLLPYTHARHVTGKYRPLGALLHSVDVDAFRSKSPDVDWMSNNSPIDEVVRFILTSESIITTSLHGVIFSHALGVPCMLVKLGDRLAGTDFKFIDYFQSVGNYAFQGRPDWSELNDLSLASVAQAFSPQAYKLDGLQTSLERSFPAELRRSIA